MKNNARTFEGTQAEYRAHSAISQSDLKLFARSRQMFYQRVVTGELEAPETSAAQQFGIAVEAAIRSGAVTVPDKVMIIPESALNSDGHRRGKAWTEWRASVGDGCRLLTPAEWQEQTAGLTEVLRQLNKHGDAWHLAFNPDVERSWHWRILWDCPATGIERKCEVDFVVDLPDGPAIVDIKTTRSNSPDGFAREIVAYGYDLQAATYLEAVESMAETQHDYYLIAVLNTPPHDVAVYRLDRKSWIEPATERSHTLLRRLAQARRDNDWIWHNGAAVTLEAPPWAHGSTRQQSEIEDELFAWEILE